MQSRHYLQIGVLFLALLSIAMAIVTLQPISPSLANILMLLVGLFTMASLTAFHRLIETAERKQLIPTGPITFNEHVVTFQIEEAAKHANVDVIDAEIVESRRESWDVLPEDLLGQDNSLALAMLRIEIERELRKLATSSGLGSMASRLSIGPLAKELQRHGILDPSLMSVLNDILPAANQAVHGMEVSTETTEVILRLGRQLLRLLQIANKRS